MGPKADFKRLHIKRFARAIDERCADLVDALRPVLTSPLCHRQKGQTKNRTCIVVGGSDTFCVDSRLDYVPCILLKPLTRS